MFDSDWNGYPNTRQESESMAGTGKEDSASLWKSTFDLIELGISLIGKTLTPLQSKEESMFACSSANFSSYMADRLIGLSKRSLSMWI